MKNLLQKTAVAQIKGSRWFTAICFIALTIMAPLANAEYPVIGKVLYVDGTALVQKSFTVRGVDRLSGQRVLKYGDEISVHDMLKTSEGSKLNIVFIDGAKLILRPDSNVFVEKYSKVEAELEIIKGGIRIITGDIVKQNPSLYKIKTPDGLVTAKSEGSDFSVRYCGNDCDQENKKMAGPELETSLPVIAKVVAIQGDVRVGDKYKRKLGVGYPVYSTEHIASAEKSFAQLQFVDGSSVSIQANSEFDISDYKYNQTGKENRSIFKLISGGLRFVTGLMGKTNRKTFKLHTSVATMGIRGTDFGVNTVGAGGSGGIVTQVFSGSVDQTNGSGTFVVNAGSFGAISSSQSPAVVTVTAPATFDNNIAPAPSKARVNPQTLFTSSTEKADPGTHVSVNKGEVAVAGSFGEPVVVSPNLAASVTESGSVTNVGPFSSFQAMEPVAVTVPVVVVSLPPNTIRIGPAVSKSESSSESSSGTISVDAAVGSSPVTTNVVQEQTITSPYNYR